MMIEAARLSISCRKICRVASRSLAAIGIEVWRASSASASSSLKRIGSSSQADVVGLQRLGDAQRRRQRPEAVQLDHDLHLARRPRRGSCANGSSALSSSASGDPRAHRRLGGDVERPDLHAADAFGEQALRPARRRRSARRAGPRRALPPRRRASATSPRCARTARCAWSRGHARSRRRCCRSARSACVRPPSSRQSGSPSACP